MMVFLLLLFFLSVKPFAQSHYAVGASPSTKSGSGASNGSGGGATTGNSGGELALLASSGPNAAATAPSASSSSSSSSTVVATVPAAGLTPPAPPPPWEGRAIATHKLRLVEFSAFLEQQRDPDTVICLSIIVHHSLVSSMSYNVKTLLN
jgi:hypothetical protein